MGFAFMDKQTNTPGEWRILAERDINVADYLADNMRPIPTEIVAFHCQQAVEKYLKGVLVILGEDPPYIHDLNKLNMFAEKHHPLFVSIRSPCAVITHFAIQPRYDLGLSLSDDDMRLVLAHTHSIKECLQKEIPQLFEMADDSHGSE